MEYGAIWDYVKAVTTKGRTWHGIIWLSMGVKVDTFEHDNKYEL